MQSGKMALFKNEIKKYDEDDEVSGTGPGGWQANFILERREPEIKQRSQSGGDCRMERAEAGRTYGLVPFVSDMKTDQPLSSVRMGEWPAENDGGRFENSRYVFGIRVSGIYSEYEGRQ